MNRQALHRFLSDDGGNFSALFALTLVPVISLVGVGIDYSMSAKHKAMLDAVADSASLAGVTPAMLSQSDSASITTATSLFNAHVPSITGIGSVALTVT